jgi:hypothetical protein
MDFGEKVLYHQIHPAKLAVLGAHAILEGTHTKSRRR